MWPTCWREGAPRSRDTVRRPSGSAIIAAVAATVCFNSVAWAQQGEDVAKPAMLLGVDLDRTDAVSLAQKKYAKSVADDLVCLCGTCPRESLATCDCSWAAKGRKTIELALLDGQTEQAVLDAYRKAFGDKAFAAPPAKVEAMVTIVSYVLGAAMLLAMIAFGLSNRRQPARAPVPKPAARPTDEDEAARILRRELEEMD